VLPQPFPMAHTITHLLVPPTLDLLLPTTVITDTHYVKKLQLYVSGMASGHRNQTALVMHSSTLHVWLLFCQTRNMLYMFLIDLSSDEYLAFLTFGCVPGVAAISLPKSDDDDSDAINIPTGVPMGNQTYFEAYVSISPVTHQYLLVT